MNPFRSTTRHPHLPWAFVIVLLVLSFQPALTAQDKDIAKKLGNFDAYMAKVLKDWNAPGIGVGIVQGDKLVFAKGYGYRDYGQKLPYTPMTLQQIASNTKLFTAIAAGMLVEEGKLTWDKPVKESVPSIKFHNNELNNTVTLRDMLAHRTGITRHDTIWYQSDDTRQQLFDKVRYLEPQEPLRQTFLYNNLMYAAVGYIIELQSGRTWEEFVRERIFKPLDMTSTIGGVAPCGAIISNLQDMSHWLIALVNEGKYNGRQVLPPAVLKAT
ncbi:MAG: serine hydrolase, partial [Candidatus Aminicenantes bacterium]|nr:serine hydrolase [Candidatus Aminicenantes bacterium]